MNPTALTREELGHYAPIDAEVAAFVAEHAPRLFEEAEDFYDPAGCYDEGHDEGSQHRRKILKEQFGERLAEALVGVDEYREPELHRLLTDIVAALE